VSLPIQKLKTKTASLPIQRLATNYVAAESEIESQKLCHCRFRNWQPKTLPLPIQESATKLRCCRFENQQPIMSMSIQKSAAKNYVATDSEIGIDGGVISALLLFFMFTNNVSIPLGKTPPLQVLDRVLNNLCHDATILFDSFTHI